MKIPSMEILVLICFNFRETIVQPLYVIYNKMLLFYKVCKLLIGRSYIHIYGALGEVCFQRFDSVLYQLRA